MGFAGLTGETKPRYFSSNEILAFEKCVLSDYAMRREFASVSTDKVINRLPGENYTNCIAFCCQLTEVYCVKICRLRFNLIKFIRMVYSLRNLRFNGL